MTNKFNFTADRVSGRPDLSDAALERFSAAMPGNKTNFTVSGELGRAAEDEILKRTRDLAFKSREPFFKCLNEVIHSEPRLSRLAFARIYGIVHGENSRRGADVGIE